MRLPASDVIICLLIPVALLIFGAIYYARKEEGGFFSPNDTYLHVQRGYEKLQNGDLLGASVEFDRMIKLKPRQSAAYLGRAVIHVRTNSDDAAIADLTRYLELKPRDEGAYLFRGDTYFRQGNFQSAIEDYTTLIRLYPNEAWPYLKRATAYRSNSDFDGAIADIEFARTIEPIETTEVYTELAWSRYYKGDQAGALLDAARAIELDPTSPYGYFARGIILDKAKDLETAISDYTLAIEHKHPELYSVYVARAYAYYQQSELDNGLADCIEAINLNADAPNVYYVRGRISQKQENWNDAITDFTRALNYKHPTAHFVHLSRAKSYFEQGNIDLAIADVTAAIELRPNDALAYNNRGFYRAVLGYLDDALRDCNKAISLDSQLSYGYGSRGYTYFLMGRYAESLADFQKSAALKPDHKFAIEGQAICYSVTGNADEANRLWKALIELDPRYKDAETLYTEYQAGDAFVNEARKIIERLT